MTAIVETSTYTETITQLETTDLVLGGVGGASNRALVELANRTKWLYDRIAALTEQPLAALPYPTIATSDNRLNVTRTTATAGGKVSIAAGTLLNLAEVVVSAATGRPRTFTTSAYTSADLLVSSTYYLRATVDSVGALAIYVQRGTDSDPIPASFVGTPDAASGGGFDSTPVDILIAKVVTGAAGTLPTVTTLANAAFYRVDIFDRIIGSSASGLVNKIHTVNLARLVEPMVAQAGWSNVNAGSAVSSLMGLYRDGLETYAQSTGGTAISGILCFAKTVTRYEITVSAENAEEYTLNEGDNPVFYAVHIRG